MKAVRDAIRRVSGGVLSKTAGVRALRADLISRPAQTGWRSVSGATPLRFEPLDLGGAPRRPFKRAGHEKRRIARLTLSSPQSRGTRGGWGRSGTARSETGGFQL